MKTDLFQSCSHCWVFQFCWHTECSLLTASSFRIWNSSAGIPSPPLTLLVIMLPTAHLTSHSRMSGLGEWSHHRNYPSCGDLFLYSSSVYSCHLVLISSASVRSISFLSFIKPIFARNVPLVSQMFLWYTRKNEGMEPKQKQYPAVDVTGNRSKVWCSKEQYCIGN